MTPFTIFVLFGLPVSLVALAWGAVFLHSRTTHVAPESRTIRIETAR